MSYPSSSLRPLSFWEAVAVRQGAWWQICKITRFWECVSPLGVLWWAWLMEQRGDLFQSNIAFADMAHYAPEPTWGLWAGLIAGIGILSALLGPPVVRALALASQMWLWTMISVHLAAAAPRIPGMPRFLPLSTGAGVYGILAGACCVALAIIFPLVFNDLLGCGRRASRAVSRSLVSRWEGGLAWRVKRASRQKERRLSGKVQNDRQKGPRA